MRTLRLGVACSLCASVLVAVACGSFDAAAPAETSLEAGTAETDGTAADGTGVDGAGVDGAGVDGSVPDGGDACAASCIATMPEDVTALGCTGDPNSPVYVGLRSQIKAIDKLTLTVSDFASGTARHIADNDAFRSVGDQVLHGQAATTFTTGASGSTATGVASTPSDVFWGQQSPSQVRHLPRDAGPDAGNVFVDLSGFGAGEGMIIRAGRLYVAFPALGKVRSFALDGSADTSDIEADPAVYALAFTSQTLFWVALRSSTAADGAVRYLQWNLPQQKSNLVTTPGRTINAICTDPPAGFVYFNVDREIHRVPVP